jgi:acyl-CoA thioesterase-1
MAAHMGEDWRMASFIRWAALVGSLLLVTGCAEEAPAPAATQAAEPTPAVTPRPVGDERVIVAFGDSLYAGYGLGKDQSLPARLESKLRQAGINATVINAGVSGDTSAAGRQRLAFTLDGIRRQPELVILGLGGNDALRQLPAAETRREMTAIMDELKRRNIPVLLTGMRAPPNLGPDYAATFETIWPDLAKQYGAALYPFILDGVITDPALMQRDGVHPTAAGVVRMADGIAPLAIKALPAR